LTFMLARPAATSLPSTASASTAAALILRGEMLLVQKQLGCRPPHLVPQMYLIPELSNRPPPT
jgi:hypothetical protein